MAAQTILQFRRGTAALWASQNPVLAAGEFGFETDTNKGKIGNGTTAYNSLSYVVGAFPASQLSGNTLASNVVTSSLTSVGTLTSLAVTNNIVYHITTNPQGGTTYTLALSDDGQIIELSNSSGAALTVPPNSAVAFPIGTQIQLIQTGAGQITVTPGSGVTVNATPGLKTRAQWSFATLIKRATDTWVLVGDITA
jgi:Major tropism determinant N-terminal domain